MKKARVLPLVLVAMLILGMVFAFAGCKTESKTIKIGLIVPMTGSESIYGTSSWNAIKFAIEDVNKAGGILGKQVEVILEDDENKPDKSVDLYKKLTTQDKVDFIIGSVGSSCTLAIAPLAQADGIPLITSASSNVDVTLKGNYIFRTCFIDPFQGPVAAKFATDNLKKKSAAILYDNGNDYSKGLASAFETAFAEMGGSVVAKEAYSKADQDFSAIIAKIKDKNPEVIYIADYYQKNALIAKQIRDAGMADVPLMGGDGWDGITAVGGKECAGSYFSNHYSPESTEPEVVAFIEKYKAANNGETPNALAALAYDAFYILTKAIAAAGTTDHAKVRDAMAATNGKFVTGNISFDENRNPTKSAVIVGLFWENDKLVDKYVATVTP